MVMQFYPTISRRSFLERSAVTLAGISALGIGSAAAGPATNDVAAAGRSATRTGLRVIAYNVYRCTGWPRDGQRAKKAGEEGQLPARLAQELALYDPDIINFSESPDESIVKEIARLLDMNYVRFPSGGNWPGTLLTRFAILESANVPLVSGKRPEDLFTRHWGKARLQLPANEEIVVHSAHLYPHDTPEAGAVRQREITEMLKAAEEDLRGNKPVLVMGDLNHTPDMPEYAQWMKAGWVDTFAKAGQGEGLTIKADKPVKRIDYVLAKGPIAEQVAVSRALFEGAFRTNPADPGSFALSDHLPQLAIFGKIPNSEK